MLTRTAPDSASWRETAPSGLWESSTWQPVGALKDTLEPYVRRWGALFMDLSELSFMDSMGRQLLTEVANRRRTSGPVVLTGAPKRFRRLFDLVGLEQVPNLKIGWAPA